MKMDYKYIYYYFAADSNIQFVYCSEFVLRYIMTESSTFKEIKLL